MTRLSSRSTYFWKFFVPISLLVIWLSLTGFLILSKNSYAVPIILCGLGFLLLFFLTTFKAIHVDFDNEFLYISNFDKEEKIPLTRIMEVNEIWMTPKMASIMFKEQCSFGKKIKYIQRTKVLKIGSTHPDLEILYKTIEKKAKKELKESKKTKRAYNLFAE